jgi:hypothetical protein
LLINNCKLYYVSLGYSLARLRFRLASVMESDSGQKLLLEIFSPNTYSVYPIKMMDIKLAKTSEEDFMVTLIVPFIYPSVRLDADQAYGQFTAINNSS